MGLHDIVVMGASSGGVEPLCTIIRALPSDLRAAVFVVMHVGPESQLAEVLKSCGSLKACNPRENEEIAYGHVYVAPANMHMRIDRGRILLDRGPRENRHRPAIDPLFRSAARFYRSRVIGIILSGALDDGVAGLFAVKERGGISIVQAPEDAKVESMPRQALLNVEVDHCCASAKIGKLVKHLVGERRATEPPMPRIGEEGDVSVEPSTCRRIPFSCPECNGPLFETRSGKLSRIECEIGHAFSPESFTKAHTEALERALWTSVRALRERAGIDRRLAEARRNNGQPDKNLLESAAQAEADIELLREIIERL
jgi:two-component system chemotaxis response regulator CheB